MIPSLLALAALGAALLFWVWHAGHETPSIRASVLKTLSTLLLAVCGLWLAAPMWIVLGLALGAAGDLALSRRGDRAFLAGMVAFALGHLAYVVEFVSAAAMQPITLPPLFWPVAAAMLALVALTALWIAPKAGGLAWPVRGYALVIGAMALSAAILPQTTGSLTIQIGVAAFVASDLILALRLFVLSQPRATLLASRLLWPLYWGGQALILAGAVA